jgi:hypothetical protein
MEGVIGRRARARKSIYWEMRGGGASNRTMPPIFAKVSWIVVASATLAVASPAKAAIQWKGFSWNVTDATFSSSRKALLCRAWVGAVGVRVAGRPLAARRQARAVVVGAVQARARPRAAGPAGLHPSREARAAVPFPEARPWPEQPRRPAARRPAAARRRAVDFPVRALRQRRRGRSDLGWRLLLPVTGT